MENISKMVISQTDGRKVGYVLDVCLDLDSLTKKGYYVVDEETESELFLSCDNIYAISDEAVVISEVSKCEFVADRKCGMIGKKVFDYNGIFFGTICQLKFSKKKLNKIITEKCEILSKFLKIIGEDVVFLEFKRKRKRIDSVVFPKSEIENMVYIQGSETYKIPEKINLSTNFYLGKIANENILGYNNEKIVSKGETITKNIVEKAKKHNKLNQLFFAIKR